MVIIPTAVSPLQTRSYAALYEQQLAGRLHRAYDFVQANQASPQTIRAHFQSILVLLERGRERPLLHSITLDLIAALHPWPVRWGCLDEWLFVLAFAKKLSVTDAQTRRHIDITIYLADLLLLVGQIDQALVYGYEALTLARRHAYAQPLVKTGWILYRALAATGRVGEANDLLAMVEAEIPASTCVDTREQEETAVWQAVMQARALRLRGQYQKGCDLLAPIVYRLAAAKDLVTDYKAEAYAMYANLLWNMDQNQQAVRYVSQAVAIYQLLGDQTRVQNFRADLSLFYAAVGQFDRAEKLMLAAIAQFERKRLHYQMAEQIGSLAGIYITQGRLAAAQPYLQKQIEITEKTGNQRELMRAVINRGCVSLLLGEFEAGLADVEIGLSYYETQNEQGILILCQMSACYAYWGLGEMEKGAALAQKIDKKVAGQFAGVPHLAVFSQRCLALYQPPEEAFRILQEAAALCRQHQMKLQEAACLLSMAGLAATPETRQACWAQGRDILLALGIPYWLEGCTPQNPPFIGMIH